MTQSQSQRAANAMSVLTNLPWRVATENNVEKVTFGGGLSNKDAANFPWLAQEAGVICTMRGDTGTLASYDLPKLEAFAHGRRERVVTALMTITGLPWKVEGELGAQKISYEGPLDNAQQIKMSQLNRQGGTLIVQGKSSGSNPNAKRAVVHSLDIDKLETLAASILVGNDRADGASWNATSHQGDIARS